MTTSVTKRQILQDAGYVYNFDREVYVNKKTKKVFSVTFVEDHSQEELLGHIAEANEGSEWRFYFNSAPSRAVQEELEEVLG